MTDRITVEERDAILGPRINAPISQESIRAIARATFGGKKPARKRRTVKEPPLAVDAVTLADVMKAVDERKKKPPRDYKAEFLDHLADAGLPVPDQEITFALPRKWRWDFAYPDALIAIEYQGGIFAKGKSGHSNVAGLKRDYEKFTEGQLRGWLVVLIDAASVTSGQAVEWVKRALAVRGGASGAVGFDWDAFLNMSCPQMDTVYRALQHSHAGRAVTSILPACFGLTRLEDIPVKKLLSWLKQMRVTAESSAYKYAERYAK